MPYWWKLLIIVAVVASLPFILGASGCSSANPLSIDQPTEVRIGQQAAADLETQYGVVNDPVQTPRVQRIGNAIARSTTRTDLPWSFKILNDSAVNAESLPGGYVYVTRGLLTLGVSDNELAGVIGHEAAHVQHKDSVHAIEKAMQYQLLEQLVLGNSTANQQAANIALQYAVELPRSRQDEYNADATGIKLAYNAGYPANGLLLFLQRLQALQGTTSSTPAWASTHPLTSDRVVRAQQLTTQVASERRPVPVANIESTSKDKIK